MAKSEYDPKTIESKWQDRWDKQNLHKTSDGKKGKDNEFILVEFAYPSGDLHVGHWYAFSVMDIYARFKRMQGKNVLFPMGFDAFGLPAENAAIKNKQNPRKWTYENINYMRKQLRSMGAMFDWSREVVTSDPEYYKWTQWLFLKLFENNLAYQAETTVNWCPSCKTVLANEQVTGGHCERCGHEVEQRKMKQWQLRITDYADRLISDLEKLDWPEPIKDSQKNWIGKSEGAEISFKLKASSFKLPVVKVFTTRPDTIFGTTYLVLSPEKALEIIQGNKELARPNDLGRPVGRGITNKEEIESYIKKAKGKTELERQENKEKTGVEIKGVKAVNPANKEEIPVWVADYVLGGYGTGAIMAVPAHDERDFGFAKKFDLKIKPVIIPGNKQVLNTLIPEGLPEPDDNNYKSALFILLGRLAESPTALEGRLVNSGKFNGRDSREVIPEITKFVGGERKTTYKMRDWVISRQRYWGCPIPIIHCNKCRAVPVSEKDLPVILPDIEDYLPTGDGKSPLAKVTNWVNVKCPKCGSEAKRETDTFDTFIDSSWYFLRYTDPNNEKEFASKEKMKAWIPVDFYSGGAEHTTMHLLYSRFFHKALHDLGLVNEPEPYVCRMNRGLILGPDGNKMSKSKGNVVNPDDYVERLGADTVRTYLAFIGPYNEVGSYPWSPDSIIGVRRFLERVWKLKDHLEPKANDEVETKLHETIKSITEILRSLKINTAVSFLMEFVNKAEKSGVNKNQYETLLKLLAPFSPHITEEIWHDIGNEGSIHEEKWPEFDPKKIEKSEVTIVVQVNGKNRGVISAKAGIDEESVKSLAIALPEIKKWIESGEVKRVFYVKNRLINIVL
ncbi:MAG: leucine--tRNA ligase [Candidatus Zambryskibacteria bacterium RIFCSPHIGHO2_01_FULL_43_25]|nr:MAG: leucine--tRNA ligase [Candidatus Zambryskibacteria bacterium RIFCSPHIGHO2_01_FULL_43_25]OHB00548.1 MAG: leucine--tRNA ligase [Candidatus Zambryskibacteria bacterium RIFCSPHIGHO2_12_FULL_44_12b]